MKTHPWKRIEILLWYRSYTVNRQGIPKEEALKSFRPFWPAVHLRTILCSFSVLRSRSLSRHPTLLPTWGTKLFQLFLPCDIYSVSWNTDRWLFTLALFLRFSANLGSFCPLYMWHVLAWDKAIETQQMHRNMRLAHFRIYEREWCQTRTTW